MKTGIELISEERKRQIEAEGWTPEHDDQHTGFELSKAASGYACIALMKGLAPDSTHAEMREALGDMWPWDEAWLKMDGDAMRMLAKAGALIAAEIDRLQRIPANSGGQR